MPSPSRIPAIPSSMQLPPFAIATTIAEYPANQLDTRRIHVHACTSTEVSVLAFAKAAGVSGLDAWVVSRTVVFRKRGRMRRLWRDYNLSVVLGILFFITWFGQLVTQWFTWSSEQQEHNQPLELGEFLWEFWQSTLENWQSEFLQLFSFVVLAAIFIHRGSAESKDSDEEMQAALGRIEKRLKALERQGQQS